MKRIKLENFTAQDFIETLNNDGLIIFPFDTCYGLVCDPTNPKAVQKLLNYKSRREGKAISISVDSIELAREYVDFSVTAENFFKNFLPGPFTLVLNSKHKFADGIEAENGTVGVRIPNYQPLINMIKAYGKPVTSTSANQSYQKTPYKVEDILENASVSSLNFVDVIVDAGEIPHNPPSTVVDLSGEEIHVLRKGSVIPDGSTVNEFDSDSVDSTINFAKKLAERFAENLKYRPVVFALQGDMGAGKTHFTKGIAEYFGVEEAIQSPTFIISREYKLKDKNTLFHIDTWRLEPSNSGIIDMKEIDFEKMIEKNPDSSLYNIIAIEWVDKVTDYIRGLDKNLKIIWIEINSTGDDSRLIKWSE